MLHSKNLIYEAQAGLLRGFWCHGNPVNGEVEKGQLNKEPQNGEKRKETFNLSLFTSFHQASSLYQANT